MVFSDPLFLFAFLPVTLAACFLLPGRWQNAWLVLASLAFYSYGEWRFLPWLLGSTYVTYLVAIGIERYRDSRTSTILLALGIGVDLALLVVFKYSGSALSYFPLGISFFTFHKISYKVDVYRRDAELKRDFKSLLLYILFFPQLIAGPIVRYREVASDLVSRVLKPGDLEAGITRFTLGLAKKVCIADPFARIADQIFSIPHAPPMATAWLGCLAYAFQIYYDFSGYSDMAIGLARILGFKFPENFNHPYQATSVTDFWRRWHISLSTWFRDYLYIPLGGNRRGALRTGLNLVTVFFLCGLWHGAAWTFVVWGLFHGMFIFLEKGRFEGVLLRLPAAARRAYALLVVWFGWVIFRAVDLPHAGGYLKSMLGMNEAIQPEYSIWRYFDGHIALLGIFVALIELKVAWKISLSDLAPPQRRLRAAATYAVLLLAMIHVLASSYHPFIYFRF